MLLDEKLHITKVLFLRDLPREFNCTCKALQFERKGAVLPSHLTVEQLNLLFQGDSILELPKFVAFRESLCSMALKCLWTP